MKHVVAVAACNKQGRIFCTNLRSTFNFCFFFYHLSMGWGGGTMENFNEGINLRITERLSTAANVN